MISRIIESLRRGESVVLATIISSSGSTPLPAGAMMVSSIDGNRISGTVGGGPLESQVLAASAVLVRDGRALESRQFILNGEEDREAMLCGGRTTVLLEKIDPSALPVIEALEEWGSRGTDTIFARVVSEDGLRLTLAAIDAITGDIAAVDDAVEPFALTAGQRMQVFQQASCHSIIQRSEQPGGSLLLQPIPGAQQALILGGGHVGRCICGIAARAGFAVTVVDDRSEFASPDRFPEAARTLHMPFGTAFDGLTITRATSILIVTRAHEYDSLLLERALGTPARYIGMLGSKRKIVACYDRLHEKGFTIVDLKRVHAPVGLDIGATSAEEIAVSVVAEMIAARAGSPSAVRSMSAGMEFYFSGEPS